MGQTAVTSPLGSFAKERRISFGRRRALVCILTCLLGRRYPDGGQGPWHYQILETNSMSIETRNSSVRPPVGVTGGCKATLNH